MDFNYNKYQIGNFLQTKKKYIIPRFQREYSWEDYELKTFFEDLLAHISVKDDDLVNNEYYFGNILLVGDLSGSDKTIDIIDGQQRVTTFTIFLSVLSSKFKEIGETNLFKKAWEYVMGKNNDDEEYAILVNDTPNPFFQYLVQSQGERRKPKSEEEDRIKNAYDYFSKVLSKDYLLNESDNIWKNNCDYITILKHIRDQLLGSFVICIWTKEQEHANLIFEILNAKGKELAAIDLIKNDILHNLTQTEPTDDAVNKWKEIIENLNSKDKRISMSTFFRHYWISKYKKCTEGKLYENFIKAKIKTKDEYQDLLNDMVTNSLYYSNILVPSLDYYDNRKEKNFIIQGFKNVGDIFNVIQTRVIFLSLLAKNKESILTTALFKKAIIFIENFHFVYTALCSYRPNKVETIYSKYAIKIRKCTCTTECGELIDKMILDMEKIFPKYEEFKNYFCEKIKYSSKKAYEYNMLGKYVVNKFENYFSNRDMNRDDASIEHIISEDDSNLVTLEIGNLIALEQNINNDIPDVSFLRKKSHYYSQSSYKHIEEFINSYDDFSVNDIADRTKKLCDLYWTKILNKVLDNEPANVPNDANINPTI